MCIWLVWDSYFSGYCFKFVVGMFNGNIDVRQSDFFTVEQTKTGEVNHGVKA